MRYQRLTCYFLSGTGNSFRAAQWLGEAARARGIPSSVIPIDRAAPRTELRPGAEQLVALYLPSHGLMPPWSMIKFLLRLPRGRGAHGAVLATRGGIRIGRLVLPGACGLALLLPLFVLALKGFRVRAGLGIDMPINVINVHWGLRAENIEHIKAWGRRRHARFAEALLDGRRFFHPLNLIWETVWPAALFWLWPIFPVAYLLVGRVSMGKIMFADTRCRGCGLCAFYCPNHAIVMVGKRRSRVPFWTCRCEACLRCMGYCRPHAVEASHFWLALLILASSFLSSSSLPGLCASVFGRSVPLPDPVWQLVSLGLGYLALMPLYYVFWGMQRWRPLHVMWSALSITRYYSRRYHDPETRQKQMR